MGNGNLLQLSWGTVDVGSISFIQDLGYWFFVNVTELTEETQEEVVEKTKEWCKHRGIEYHEEDFLYDEMELHLILSPDAPMRYDLGVVFDHAVLADFDSVFLEVSLDNFEKLFEDAIMAEMHRRFFEFKYRRKYEWKVR